MRRLAHQVVSFVPTLLVWCNVERFEVLSHEVEYSNEISMSFVDLVLLTSLLKQRDFVSTGGVTNVIMAGVATAVAVLQIVIYNGMGMRADGGLKGEKLAHYCEFSFEIISALIVFWFCVDNKVLWPFRFCCGPSEVVREQPPLIFIRCFLPACFTSSLRTRRPTKSCTATIGIAPCATPSPWK